MKIAIIGYGYVGKAYNKVFPDAVIYDEPKGYFVAPKTPDTKIPLSDGLFDYNRLQVNECDMAIVAVPTNPLPDGSLDTSIVEEVVSWLDTPLILIKSALMPGTVDRLVKETGKKIAVSVEMVGMGNYYIPPEYPDPVDPTKHKTLIVGGDLETATKCAEILWSKMSPTIRIHLVSALEAEITKLVENAYGALKVSWINSLMSLTDKAGANFIQMHQAWTSDPRVDGMHQRAVSFNRGWKSHCWSKDIPALKTYARQVGAPDLYKLLTTIMEINEVHLGKNKA